MKMRSMLLEGNDIIQYNGESLGSSVKQIPISLMAYVFTPWRRHQRQSLRIRSDAIVVQCSAIHCSPVQLTFTLTPQVNQLS
jgi:hypothetical protein